MLRGKLFLVSSIVVLLLVGLTSLAFSSSVFSIEQRTVPEGTITEETEVVEAAPNTIVINELAHRVNEIVTEAGVVVENVEVINPDTADLAQSGNTFRPIDIAVDQDGVIAISPDEFLSTEAGSSVTRIEVAEGVVTEVIEVAAINQEEPELTLVDAYINEVELPQGTIIERVEVYGLLSDNTRETVDQGTVADFLPLPVFVDEDNPQRIGVRPNADSVVPLSWSVFIDTLYATCSSGARFEYSSSTGTSVYTLRWSGGEFSNDKTCSGSQCHYTISTSWNAYYTYADAQILAPAQVWGPANAYRCN